MLKPLNLADEETTTNRAAQIASLEKDLQLAKSDAVKTDLKRQISRLKTVAATQERTERFKLIGTLSNALPISPNTSPNRSASSVLQLAIHGDGELLTLSSAQLAVRNDDENQRRPENPSSRVWAWDIATQTPLRQWDDLQSGWESVVFVESLNQLVSPSGRVFGLSNGQSQSLGELSVEPISALALAPNGKHFAVGHAGFAQAATKSLRLLDVVTLQEVNAHEAFEALVTAVTFAPDGESLAVAVRERQYHRLLVLDTKSFAVLATVEESPHSTPWVQGRFSAAQDRGLTTVLFSSDGRYLLAHGSYGTSEYRLTVWQKKGGKWTKETAVSTKANQPLIADTHASAPIWFVGGKGNQLAAITSKGLGIVEISNGRLNRSVELRDGQKDRGPVTWSADGTWLAQGDETGHVTLWNLRAEKEASRFAAQLGPVKALALSHDGRVLATLGEENKLHLWNLEGRQPKNRISTKSKTAKPTATAE